MLLSVLLFGPVEGEYLSVSGLHGRWETCVGSWLLTGQAEFQGHTLVQD